MKIRKILLLSSCMVPLAMQSNVFAAAETVTPKVTNEVVAPKKKLGQTEYGNFYLKARLRTESVDGDGKIDSALATTTRIDYGFKTKSFNGFSANLVAQNISSLFGDTYNSTSNNKTQYPIISDPTTSFRLLDANVQYNDANISKTKVSIGKTTDMDIDNQRFIGSVNWRQDQQNFDAVSIKNTFFKNTELNYAYIWGVNTPKQLTYNSNSNIIRAKIKDITLGNFTFGGRVQSLLLDLGSAPSLSSKTFGIQNDGKYKISDKFSASYNIELAEQSDYATNQANFSTKYNMFSLGLSYDKFSITAIREVLGSNGQTSFQTPLATLHVFNGWADRFLTTPKDGLIDKYIEAKYKQNLGGFFKDVTFNGAYHVFTADNKSNIVNSAYGKEWNALVSTNFGDNGMYSVMLKGARYNTENIAIAKSVTKLWVMFEAKIM